MAADAGFAEVVTAEVDGDVHDVGGDGAERLRNSSFLLLLDRRTVYLEHSDSSLRECVEAVGSCVEAGTEDDQLPDPAVDAVVQEVIDVPGASDDLGKDRAHAGVFKPLQRVRDGLVVQAG